MEIFYSRRAEKFLLQLQKSNPKSAKLVAAKISRLAENPAPDDVKKVRGAPEGHVRIPAGDFRVLYLVENNSIIVKSVDRRNDDQVYRKEKRRKYK